MISLHSYMPLLLFFGLSHSLLGQSPTLFQLDLNKDFISWVWSADLRTSVQTGSQSRVDFGNQFKSSLFRQSARQDKWRDENTLALSWRTRLGRRFETRSLIESRVFSDENTSREFNKHLIAQELTIQLHPQVQLVPAAGLALEEAFDIQDEGWYAKAGLVVNRFKMGDYLNYTDAKSELRAFPGRENQEHTFFTGWTRQFSERASDSLRLGYQFSENRYFVNRVTPEIPEPVEQVTITARFLFNQLQYQVSSNSLLMFLTQFRDRDIDQTNPFNRPQHRRREELVLDNQLQYLIFWGGLQLENGLYFSQARNDNPGVDADVNTLQTAINTALRYRRGDDLLWGKFSYTKFEYNTPNAEEGLGSLPLTRRQDRDEQRFIIDMGYRHRFSPFFALTLQGNVYLFHQIYLRAGRSQNNNWNRIFQLAAHFNHQISSRVQHTSQLKILSNFTVFDFEELLPQVRSFVFRKLIYSDSLGLALTQNLTLNGIYQLEKEDNGTFFQKAFAQQVTRELTAHFITINLERKALWGMKLTTGFTLFLRDEWGFAAPDRERRKVRKFRSTTPRMTLTIPASKRLMLFLNYAPNRSQNFTRALTAADFREDTQNFTSGSINLRYSF